MGTLSGGGKEVISIGERCLLGANAGIGISLGDDCVVEAGCYVTAGTKVTVPDRTASRRWSRPPSCPGADNVLFRRNSVDRRRRGGAVEGRGHRAQRRPARQLTAPARRRTARPRSLVVAAGRRRRSRSGVAAPARRRPAARPRGLHAPRSAASVVDLTTEQARERRADRRDRGPARACRRGPPSIALATAYQESKLRNLEPRRPRLARAVPAAALAGLGHARRRSCDPYYATNAFYDALAKSTATSRCGSPRPPRRCSAPASPRRTPTTRPTPGRSPRR